jgi:hypothetical protein
MSAAFNDLKDDDGAGVTPAVLDDRDSVPTSLETGSLRTTVSAMADAGAEKPELAAMSTTTSVVDTSFVATS